MENEDQELLPVLRQLDGIEELADAGWGCFGQRVIDEEAFFVKLTRLRSVLPPVLQQSVDLLQKRDHLLEQLETKANLLTETARREAKEIQSMAREEATLLVEAAGAQREQILQQACNHAKQMVEEAQLQTAVLLTQHTLINQAQQYSLELRQSMAEDEQELKAEMTRYSLEVLDRVSALLGKLEQRVHQDKLQFSLANVTTDNQPGQSSL
jgi:cell division septum initiation protein DivIVA